LSNGNVEVNPSSTTTAFFGRIHRPRGFEFRCFLAGFRALHAPVVLRDFHKPGGGSRFLIRLHAQAQQRIERAQGFLDVRVDGYFGGIVLAEFPGAFGNLHDRHAVRQRVDRVVHRHAQDVRAQADQQVIRLQPAAHLRLAAGELAGKGRMFGKKVGGVRHGLLPHGRAQHFRKLRRFLQCIAGGEFVPGNQHGIAR
jgi:hypothetical protein